MNTKPNIPCIVHVFYSTRKAKRVLLRRIVYKRCHKVVSCSKKLYDIAQNEWNLTPAHLLHIPNGINCSIFTPALDKPKSPNETVNLGIVASLIKLKNHSKLLRSMALIAENISLTLYIVGDGTERENLQKQCWQLGIANNVHFMGYMQNPASILQKLDIFCLASDTEQMPMSILEAMATGIPILSTDVGDVKDMVSEENRRFIVDRDSDAAFTKALLELCSSQSLREKVGKANFERCRKYYDQKFMFEQYRKLYTSAIG